jgi:hypothetical protein
VESDLLPTRSCGECNVCCVALTINDPELQKPQGYRCPNSLPDHGCAIYETRPHTCRTFFCGWRRLKWIRETLRPDRSGVLVRLHVENKDGAQNLGVVFTLINNAALKADGLAETVAAGVLADIPVYLHVPGPPGYTASQVKINDALQHAVLTKDKPALLEALRRIRAIGAAAKHEPIVMSRRTEDQPPNA